MNSQITLYVDRSAIGSRQQSRSSIRFRKKAVKYINGFTDGGIVRYGRRDEYGTVKIGSKKVTVTWDDGTVRSYSAFYDEETQTHYSAVEIAQLWGCMKPVPWFIAGQTIVIIPRPDGSIARPECEYRVVSVDSEWIEVRQVSSDRVDRYPIGELPGFPFLNDVVIKERPLLPIPPRHELKFASRHYLWHKNNLADLVGQKQKLYEVFRKEQSHWSIFEEDFVWAWEKEWEQHTKIVATNRGHGGKKIGTRLYIEGAIETISDFDTETFEFITDCDKRIPLLQLYLYPELVIEKLADNFVILKADEYIEARIGFNNKQKAKKQEVSIKRLSGCKRPTLVAGGYTGYTYEWLLTNPFKKEETFMKHLKDLSAQLPK